MAKSGYQIITIDFSKLVSDGSSQTLTVEQINADKEFSRIRDYLLQGLETSKKTLKPCILEIYNYGGSDKIIVPAFVNYGGSSSLLQYVTTDGVYVSFNLNLIGTITYEANVF